MLGAAPPETVTIFPLDAARNPYRKEYEPWDAWVYQHAVNSNDPAVERYFREEGLQGNVVLQAYVDGSGFLVPQRVAEQRRLRAAAAEDDNWPTYLPDWKYVVFAAGPIEPGLLVNYHAAMLGLRAEYMVTIPSWLARHPPAWAMILPPEAGAHAGEVIMFGQPGVDPDFALTHGDVRPPASRAIFYRYSASGQLLSQTERGQEWWELYTANPATPPRGGGESRYRVFEANGLISVTDIRTGKRAWLMDLDGKHLPDVAHPPRRNANHWLGLTANELTTLYALQRGQPLPAPGPEAPPRTRPKPKPLGGARS